MNKAMKKHLEAVVDSIVTENVDAGNAALHEYIRAKSQTILLGEKADEDTDDDEDDEDDEDKKEGDKKVPAFLKKSKKGKKAEEKDDEGDDD